MTCGLHHCVLGGCHAWNKFFGLIGAARVVECAPCKEHRRWCKDSS